jgi:hypothetical protein
MGLTRIENLTSDLKATIIPINESSKLSAVLVDVDSNVYAIFPGGAVYKYPNVAEHYIKSFGELAVTEGGSAGKLFNQYIARKEQSYTKIATISTEGDVTWSVPIV